MPAPAHALAVERRGLVEVAGFGRAPVHHEPLQIIGGQADAADVLRLTGVEVQAAEHQAVVDGVELGQAVLVEGREGVAFGNVLHGAHCAGAAHLRQLGALFLAQFIKPGIQAGNIVPFVGQIGVEHQTFPYRKRQTVHSTTISVSVAAVELHTAGYLTGRAGISAPLRVAPGRPCAPDAPSPPCSGTQWGPPSARSATDSRACRRARPRPPADPLLTCAAGAGEHGQTERRAQGVPATVRGGQPERRGEPGGTAGQVLGGFRRRPPHEGQFPALHHFARAQQDSGGVAGRSADDVGAVVHAVREVDIEVARPGRTWGRSCGVGPRNVWEPGSGCRESPGPCRPPAQ